MASNEGTRQARMSAHLGDEQVMMKNVRCTDVMGGSFELEVDIVSSLGDINLMPQLGQPIAVHVDEHGEIARHFHGLIVGGDFLHERAGRHYYRIFAKPFTHFLSHNQNMAIFQNKSVPDIIKEILENAGYQDHDFSLSIDYPLRDYCVQYRESDLAFITRLMEEEGIYYYWRHSESAHTMVFCDHSSAHNPGKPATLDFNPHAGDGQWATSLEKGGGKRHLMQLGETLSTGAETLVTLRSFDFKKPQQPLETLSHADHNHFGGSREVYDYPAPYLAKPRGDVLSAKRLDSLRRDRQVYEGTTPAVGLACGTKLEIVRNPTERLNLEYLITRTEHVIQNEAYWSADSAHGEEAAFEHTHVTFHAIPAAAQFRLVEETPKPLVYGLETAIVTGPGGEEIYTDEYGRVKVRFHWDRSGSPSESSTCWIRVAQFGGLGNVILPRVGQEVMVNFLHGNPDEPVVMGWVFNQSHMPVYDLPKHKTRHVFRGRSYPGGKSIEFDDAIELDTGSPGANEIRFEDNSGCEEVFIHAERDLKERVRFDATLQVGRNENKLIGKDRIDEVKNDETTTIGKDQKLTVRGNQSEGIEASRKIEVNSDDSLKVGTTQTIKVGTDLKIDAGMSCEITVGPCKIKMDMKGITIEAPIIEVKATATATVTSMKTTLEGSALNTITGAMVMIN